MPAAPRALQQRSPAASVLSRAVLLLAVLVWAIWTGGQVYHAMTIVPMWSTDPPDSLSRFSDAGQGARSLPFFLIFSTAWPALLAGAAAVFGRSVPWRERRWTAAFALGATIITVALVVWMAPTIQGLFAGEYGSAEEARRTFAVWERANLARLFAEVALLLVGLRALLGAYRAS